MSSTLNPFRYSGPVPVEDVIGRDEEVRTLVDLAAGGHNTRVQAPRGYGKTSLLRKVLAEAQREGLRTVYVDLYGVLSRADIGERIERAYRGIEGRFRRVVRSAVKEAQISVTTPAGVGVQAQGRTADPSLMRMLDLPELLFRRDGILTVVVFDEFQDLLGAEDMTDRLIRSVIQHHAREAGYIFAGSRPGMMRELFDNQDRAFYRQAQPFDLAPLPLDVVTDAIYERFERHGRDAGTAVDPLVAFTRGHPLRTMQLAHHLFRLCPVRATADEETWVRALSATYGQAEPELRRVWDALDPAEQRVVAAVAAGESPLAQTTLRRFDLAKSTARAARDRLLKEGALLTTGPVITDPLFAAWVRAGRREPREDD